MENTKSKHLVIAVFSLLIYLFTLFFVCLVYAEDMKVKGKINKANFSLNGDIEFEVSNKASSIARKAYNLSRKLKYEINKLLKDIELCSDINKKLDLLKGIESRVYALERVVSDLYNKKPMIVNIKSGISEKTFYAYIKEVKDDISKLRKEMELYRIRLELIAAVSLDMDLNMSSSFSDAQQLNILGLVLSVPMSTKWNLRAGGGIGINSISKRLGLMTLASLEYAHKKYLSYGPVVLANVDKDLSGMHSFNGGAGCIVRFTYPSFLNYFGLAAVGVNGDWRDSKETFGWSLLLGVSLSVSDFLR